MHSHRNPKEEIILKQPERKTLNSKGTGLLSEAIETLKLG